MGFRPLFSYHGRRRHGVSPVIATVMILAITVVLGLALWSFVNGQVSTSTESFANQVTDYINYVNDRFLIVNMAFNYDANPNLSPPACPKTGSPPVATNCVSVWVYNYGNLPMNIAGVFFGSSSSSLIQINAPSYGPANLQVAPKTIGVISLDATAAGSALTSGSTYYVKIVSVTGAYQTYFQKNG